MPLQTRSTRPPKTPNPVFDNPQVFDRAVAEKLLAPLSRGDLILLIETGFVGARVEGRLRLEIMDKAQMRDSWIRLLEMQILEDRERRGTRQ